ncbi:MAG: DMT family transporter [Anaerolineae bacterium]|nr:DMT family transporter [Anaerolineae bacterium]
MKNNTSAAGILAAIGAICLWGSSFILTKNILNEGGPFTVTAIRLTIGLALLLPLSLRQGFDFKLVFNGKIILMGIAMAAAFAFQNLGLQLTSAGSAALIQAGMPAMVAIVAFGFMGEKASWKKIAGIALSVGGVILVTGSSSGNQADSLTGNLLVIVSVVAWTVYTIQGKRVSGLASSLAITAAVFIATLAASLPFTAWELASQGLPHFTPGGIAVLVYLGLGASAISFFLWNFTLSHLDTTVAGAFGNLEPVIGLLIAVLLGEQAYTVQIAGGTMAILGVWLCNL